MKNKIVFVGAMAAVLGAADASAVEIASKKYVDDQVGEVSTTVTELNQTVTEVQGDVTNITQMLGDTLSGEETLKDLLDAKADQDDLDELDGRVEELEGTVEGLETTVEGKQDKLTSNNFKGENGVTVTVTDDEIKVSGTVASKEAFGVVKAGTGLTADAGTLSVDTDAVAKSLAEDDSIKGVIEGKIADALGDDGVIQDAIDSVVGDALGDYQKKLTAGDGIDISEENEISVKTKTGGHITADTDGIAIDFAELGENQDFQSSISGALNSEHEDLQKAVDAAVAGAITGGDETGSALTNLLEDNLGDYAKTSDLGALASLDEVDTAQIKDKAVTADKLGDDLANLKEMAKAACGADSSLCVLSYNGSDFSWVDVTNPIE